MPATPLVSVVMPVYNSEGYLGRAVRSVLGQTYRNLELILVDDGSQDGSGELCDAFAREDGRVTVIHKRNGGICSARNAGLNAAHGVYVAFCDNDDEYLPRLIEDNVALAVRLGKDEVRFLRDHRIMRDGEVIRHEVLGEGMGRLNVSDDTFRDHYLDLARTGGGVWTGLYRKEMLDANGIRFPEGMRFGYEDQCFNLMVYKATGNVAVNPQVYYFWNDRYGHSTTRKFSTNRLDSMCTWLKLEGEVERRYAIADRDRYAWASYLVDTHVIRMLQQLSLPMCDLSAREKSAQLKRFARQEALSTALDKVSVVRGRIAPKTRLVMLMLKLRAYGPLIRVYTLNARRARRIY